MGQGGRRQRNVKPISWKWLVNPDMAVSGSPRQALKFAGERGSVSIRLGDWAIHSDSVNPRMPVSRPRWKRA